MIKSATLEIAGSLEGQRAGGILVDLESTWR
jgi:hypothetical protein